MIDAALERVEKAIASGGHDPDGIQRLAIFIPPRHGKSQTAARLFPAWFLGRNPDKRVILTGYGASLVDKHSRAARNLICAEMYGRVFPDVRVADDSSARSAWDIAGHEGGMDAVGIGGAVTGKGAHLLVIDDPVKSRQEAESRLQRERVWETYTSDLLTRIEPGGAEVLIMTRWHEDDLGGRLLSRTEGWTVIRLPALAELGDTLDRSEGEALWARRYSVARLMQFRADMGAYSFTAMYQQTPRSREGALFKMEWIVAARQLSTPELRRVVVAVDPAVTATANSDETGIVVVGMSGSGRDSHGYVLEDGSLRGSPDAWARQAIALYHKYRAAAIVVEVNQGGDMVVNTIKTIDRNVKIKPVRAMQGKSLRAEPIAALYEQGRVHHLGEMPRLEDQMCQWTPADRESPDRLDALVWGLTDLLVQPTGVFAR